MDEYSYMDIYGPIYLQREMGMDLFTLRQTLENILCTQYEILGLFDLVTGNQTNSREWVNKVKSNKIQSNLLNKLLLSSCKYF